ncbi:MAG: thioredoxin family protein [Planctomycetota bacterium]|nr:thioredoxin family protein [Planctomycetota bacterium]
MALLIENLPFPGPAFAQEPDQPERTESESKNPELVPLLHDYDEAIEVAKKLDRPILIVLGAEWCAPCKQLEKELELPTAEVLFRRWVVVKIDIDEEVALAKEWQVNSVPAFRILGIDQEVYASNEGFGGLKKLVAWLEENFEAVNPKTQRFLREDKPVDSEIVMEWIRMLRDKRPSSRKLVIERLSKNKDLSARPVIETLAAGNLSQKLGALEILEKWSAPIAGLDPWEPYTISKERLELLSRWLSGVGQSLSAGPD